MVGTAGVLGQFSGIGNIRAKVDTPRVGGDDFGPWLSVTVAVQNPTAAEVQGPTFALRCTGDPQGGGWQAESTFNQNRRVPATAEDNGTLNLLMPGDSRTGKARTNCATPAVIAVEYGQARAVWPIDNALIEAMNKSTAISQPAQ